MEIFRIREELKIRPIREIPLRVTYYARVRNRGNNSPTESRIWSDNG